MTNVMTKSPARQRILTYLTQHHGASALEISRALDVTAANIRHHLSILVADGRAQVLGSRLEQGRGRPVQVYGIGESAQGDNLAGLAGALLSRLMENALPEERENLLADLAGRLAPQSGAQANLHITRRLAQIIARLNRFGYAARWEAHAIAPRIIFDHCPYAALIQEHPEICQMDAHILRQGLGSRVEQTARLEKNARGITFCQFELR